MTENTRRPTGPTRDRTAAVAGADRYADHATRNRPFERGPAVADGGSREADDETDPDEETEVDDADPTPRMKDVDHTPPDENRDVNRVFERGGTEEPVEHEE